MNRLDKSRPVLTGHVLIRDKQSKAVLRSQHNAIHPENLCQALAYALANQGWTIAAMAFGNGAVIVNAIDAINYFAPNIVGGTATLYNQTYSKVVDQTSSDPNNCFITISHTNGTTFSDVVVTCTLEEAEPVGQDNFDTTTTLTGPFVFNEIGLVTSTNVLLTHCIFSPVQKALNRAIEVIYTLRLALT